MTTQPTLTPARVRGQVARRRRPRRRPPPRSTSSTCAGCSASRRPHEADPTGDASTPSRSGVEQGRRRRRLRRRLEARLLRLGVQGQGQGPEGRLRPAPGLQGRPRATRRSWSSATSTGSRSTPTSPASSPVVKVVTLDDLAGRRPVRRPASPARRLHRARGAPPAHRAGPDHRAGGRATSPRSPRASAPAATTRSASPTSWTGSCSACSPRTPASCRRASSRACRRPPTAAPTSSRAPSASCSRR